MTTLQEAAQAVLDRWDSPAWRWDKHGPTADLMADLRAALATLAALAAPEQRRPLTDEECDAVASALDNWARSVDHYEHGLPLYNKENQKAAREVIRTAHGIKEEK